METGARLAASCWPQCPDSCWTVTGYLYDKCVSVGTSTSTLQTVSQLQCPSSITAQQLTSSAWTRAARAAVSATITFSCSRGGVTTATTAPPPAITSGGGAESPRAGALSSCGAGARCENSARLRSREVTRGHERSVEVSEGQWRSPEVGREHGEDLLQPLGPRPVSQLAVVEGHVVAGGGRGGHRAAAGLLLSTTSRPLHFYTSYSVLFHIHTYVSTTFCSYVHWCTIYLCICQPPHPPRAGAGWRSAAAATSAPAPGPPCPPPAEAEAAPSWSWGAGWRGRRGPPSDGSWCVRAGPGPGPHCRGWPRPPPAAHRIDLCS